MYIIIIMCNVVYNSNYIHYNGSIYRMTIHVIFSLKLIQNCKIRGYTKRFSIC